MLQSFYLDNSIRSSNCVPNQTGLLHSCPFCRCKSLDASINIKISPKPTAGYNIRLGKDFIQTKTRNSKIDQTKQNVYYRTFESPRRRGLSPNGNKKIVIQYLSPQPTIQNSSTFKQFAQPFTKPFAKPIPNHNIKTSFIVSSPMKMSPRNIYTNQNTPPKAKLLQKKSSRKNSVQTKQYTTPVMGLTFVDSQRVSRPFSQQQQREAFVSFVKMQQRNIIKRNNKQKQQISVKRRIDYYEKIPQTQTRNIIKRAIDNSNSSSSPHNSLINSSPQVAPYNNNSTPSTPGIKDVKTNNILLLGIKNIGPLIKEMIQFSEESRNEHKLQKKNSQPIVEVNRIQQMLKNVELTPRSERFSHQKFDKTLGKVRSIKGCNDNELVYSESDRQTLDYHGGSEKNLVNKNNLIYTNNPNEKYSRSEQQITRPISEQNIINHNKNNFQTIQMSDNFSTPKSKYKMVREQVDREGKKNSGIRFYPLGDNRKSKLSNVNKEDRGGRRREDKQQEGSKFLGNQDFVVNNKREETMENKTREENNEKTLAQQSSIKLPNLAINSQTKSHNNKKQQQQSSLSDVYAAELAQQLNLNYDYYFYKPVHNANLYSNHDKPQTSTQQKFNNGRNNYVKDSSVSENEDIDVTF